jgi:hypothetical protein
VLLWHLSIIQYNGFSEIFEKTEHQWEDRTVQRQNVWTGAYSELKRRKPNS